MSDERSVVTYKGRPIETLTREELLVALADAYREIRRNREWQIQQHEMDELFRLAGAR